MRGARCSRVLTEFHMTPSPLSVAARPRCSPAFALLLRPDSRGTMLDLCYSEKCIATMGAENNWDDCGLDDTCGACPARFCMRPCCAHRCHGSTSPHASLGYLPERQSRAPPRGGAARLCRGYSAAAPRPRHLHRARTRVYPMGCAYTPSSPAVAEYCSACSAKNWHMAAELKWLRRAILQLMQSCFRCRAHAAQQGLLILRE